MLYAMLPPKWLIDSDNNHKPIQLDCDFDKVLDYNDSGYNIYYYPNYPLKLSESNKFVQGEDIDIFGYVFVDMDLKEGIYTSKEEFLGVLGQFEIVPTRVVDSGNGIHAYWKISDLTGMDFLKLNRRLARKFNTDLAVSKIKQLMRVPETANTKNKDNFVLCTLIYEIEGNYTCEDLDRVLPRITQEDVEYCDRHYNSTYKIQNDNIVVEDSIPLKFMDLINRSSEAKNLWIGEVGDRSKADWRLAHIMLASSFTKDEARSVLVNSRKASERGPTHRFNYANNIVEKVWEFVDKPSIELNLSSSVKDILSRSVGTMKGTRFPCNRLVDATENGFRLTEVMGLVGGSGSGKTTFTLNLFRWFVQLNPEYVHFFVSLEQPEKEIANRWSVMCGDDTRLNEMVQVLGNYNEDGSHRNLSLSDIKKYIIKFQETTGKKAGCVVIDHIGALKKKSENGENQGLIEICQEMKAFAVQTNTFLVMQSQTSREKAGIGDIELNKDGAYGTATFEWFVDYLVTIWQPLKRVYDRAPNLTVTAYKFCKIREKNTLKDIIQEDGRYRLIYDPNTKCLRELTQDEEKSFSFFNSTATNIRKQDRKTELLTYKSTDWVK